MPAFPTTDLLTSNLDSGTDKPKDARSQIYTGLVRINQIMDSFNQNSGICGLDNTGKVPSVRLDNRVNRDAIVNDAVNGSKIDNNSIDSDHYVNGSIDFDHLATSLYSSNANLDGAQSSNQKFPTQAAVKSYVDTRTTPGLNFATTKVRTQNSSAGTADVGEWAHIPSLDVSITTAYEGSAFQIFGQGLFDNSQILSSTTIAVKLMYKVGSGAFQDFDLMTQNENNAHKAHTYGFLDLDDDQGTYDPMTWNQITSAPSYAVGNIITFGVYVKECSSPQSVSSTWYLGMPVVDGGQLGDSSDDTAVIPSHNNVLELAQ